MTWRMNDNTGAEKTTTDSGIRRSNPRSSLPSSPSDGDLCNIRAGSSPYEFLAMVYDATYGKWVSTQSELGSAEMAATFTSAAVAYTATTAAQMSRTVIPNYLDLYNAGVRLQVMVNGLLSNSGANNTFMNCFLFGYTSADANLAQIGTTGVGEIQNTAAAAKYLSSGWVDLNPAAPTGQHGVLIPNVKVSAGTGTFAECQVLWRYVA